MEVGKILQNKGLYRNTDSKIANNTSIELPAEIASLITGSDYWKTAKQNRYKKLIRDGYMSELMQLAEIAKTKRIAANWFAKAASKANWERTLEFIAKMRKVAQDAAEVARRLGVPSNNMKAIYKACWKHGSGVIRHAVTAAELGREPYRYFNWLAART